MNLVEQIVSAGIPEGLKVRANEIEAALLKLPQVPCEVTHTFGPGTYVRQVVIPADTVVMGHEHKEATINIFLKGRGKFIMENGETKELEAPMVFLGSPGRKMCHAYEEIVWLNVHQNPTNETNIEKLEEMFIKKSEAFELTNGGRKCLG